MRRLLRWIRNLFRPRAKWSIEWRGVVIDPNRKAMVRTDE